MYISGLNTRDLQALGKRSIARHLALLCAAIVLPTLILIALLAWFSAAQHRERTRTQVEDVAVAASVAMDREIAAYEAMLGVLATAPSLEANDLAAFHDRALRLARAQGLVVSLREPDGRQLMSTAEPFGTKLPAYSLAVDRLALSTGKPQVGDLTLAEPGRGLFSIVYPIRRASGGWRLLTATIPAERTADALREVLPSEVWAASISDRRGLVIGRTRDQARWVGEPITEPLRRAAVTPRGNWTGPSHEGRPLIGGFARSAHSGWLAAVGVNRDQLSTPARSSALAVAAAAVLFALLSAAFAVLFARHLVRPLEQLASQAGDLADGRVVKPLSSGFREVDGVSASLASAAAAIDQRDQALRNAYFELESANVRLAQEVASRTKEVEDTAAKLFQSQKMESLGRLTGGVAHDFNNLLTPIVGYLDLLRTQHGDERSRRLIDGAMESAERAAALVKHLLSFARRQELEPRPVSPAMLVGHMRDLVERCVGARIRVMVDVAPDLPAVLVDPNQLELALLNLAVNSRDAMPDGGTLTIAAEEDEAGADRDRGLAPGRYVRFTVSDTGQGMDEDTLRRATEPFFTTKEVGRGTGLGLSMTHGLAAQSGGAFQLESQPGVGTRASLWLPVATETRLEGGAISSVGRAQGTGTVLLVDDDPRVRSAEAEGLRDLGYTVVEACSGEDALALVRDGNACDLLLTDQSMPGMTGLELAEAVQALRPGLPVLLATGHTEIADLPDSVELIAKPFRQAELGRRLDGLLRKRTEPAGLPLLPC